MKNYIVINDFRSIPLFSAVSIALRTGVKQTKFIVSHRNLNSIEYGQYMPNWYKKIKLKILKCFFDIIVVPKYPDTDFHQSALKGIVSSLQSITCDSGATEKLYPVLTEALKQQAIGSQEIGNYILSLNEAPKVVYIFNGRTASASACVYLLHNENINIRYYEYSTIVGGYNDYPYPCHSSFQLGQSLMELWRKNTISKPELFVRGLNYENEKLNNTFVKSYVTSVSDHYDIVVFLGSDHEYTNLQTEIVKMKAIENIGLVEHVLKKYGSNKKIAVKAHPNQRNDPSSLVSLKPIMDLCKTNGYTYFGPESGVSSYDLIRNSSLVIVEYSSIVLDAIFLGANVEVVGDRDLKVILKQLVEIDKIAPGDIKYHVREIMTLYNELFFHRFPSIFVYQVIRIFERIDQKLNKLKNDL